MRKIITFTATTLLMASAFGAGEVYRWRGADGAWHYSDQPRPGAELVKGAQYSRPTVVAELPTDQTAAPADAPAPAPAVSNENLPVSDAVAAEVRAAASAAKADQCKKAEEMYQKSLQARRITRTDAQGNKTFMDEAEMDKARLQARANRDIACGPGG